MTRKAITLLVIVRRSFGIKKEVKNRYDILDIKDGGKADNDIRSFGIVTKERQ